MFVQELRLFNFIIYVIDNLLINTQPIYLIYYMPLI